MTALDTAIQSSVNELGITLMPFFIDDGKILVGDRYVQNLSVMIQRIDDLCYMDENGNVVREIDFYLLTDYDITNFDVVNEINPKYEDLTNKTFAFIELLRNSFDVELKDKILKYRNQTTMMDLGVAFTLIFKYNQQCSL